MRSLTEELFRYSVITATAEELRRETVCLNDVLEQSLAGFYGALSAAAKEDRTDAGSAPS